MEHTKERDSIAKGSGWHKGHETRPGPPNEPHALPLPIPWPMEHKKDRSSIKKNQVRTWDSMKNSQVLQNGARAPPRNGAHAPPPIPHGPRSRRRRRDSTRKGQISIKQDTNSIKGEAAGIRGKPVGIRKQTCRQQDGDMEMDGDMAVDSVKIKTLSIKIKARPIMKKLLPEETTETKTPNCSRVNKLNMSHGVGCWQSPCAYIYIYYVCIYVYIYVCMYVCMHMYIHTYSHPGVEYGL